MCLLFTRLISWNDVYIYSSKIYHNGWKVSINNSYLSEQTKHILKTPLPDDNREWLIIITCLPGYPLWYLWNRYNTWGDMSALCVHSSIAINLVHHHFLHEICFVFLNLSICAGWTSPNPVWWCIRTRFPRKPWIKT